MTVQSSVFCRPYVHISHKHLTVHCVYIEDSHLDFVFVDTQRIHCVRTLSLSSSLSPRTASCICHMLYWLTVVIHTACLKSPVFVNNFKWLPFRASCGFTPSPNQTDTWLVCHVYMCQIKKSFRCMLLSTFKHQPTNRLCHIKQSLHILSRFSHDNTTVKPGNPMHLDTLIHTHARCQTSCEEEGQSPGVCVYWTCISVVLTEQPFV